MKPAEPQIQHYKDILIDTLKLQPHPMEGGYFSRTYESDLHLRAEGDSRLLATSIYYLLTDDSPIGFMHRNRSDIVHCYHLGGSIKYTLLNAEGKLQNVVLGPDIENGEVPQLVVKGGCWKIAELVEGDYSLITEVVVPGFEYQDNEIATYNKISQLFPELAPKLRKFIAD